MLFLWDRAKATVNLRKHRVAFELAQTIFDDPLHLSVLDKKSTTEERWVTIGQTAHGKTLVVVHTYHSTGDGEEIIRLISARLATRKEIRHYEKGI